MIKLAGIFGSPGQVEALGKMSFTIEFVYENSDVRVEIPEMDYTKPRLGEPYINWTGFEGAFSLKIVFQLVAIARTAL